jgi:succinate dehydrogenase (ubiquinone) cytochrome b560 subunit
LIMISLGRAYSIPVQLLSVSRCLMRGASAFSTQTIKNSIHERKIPTVKDRQPGALEFFNRNEKLHRPLSPHLTIYQFQLPMMLSGTHRVSGAMLGLGLGLTSLAILVAPQDFDHYVELIRSWHPNQYFIFLTKLSAAWLLCYHYINGIRHLFWDAGKGFGLPELYRSGYAVLALSVLCAIYLALQ